MQDSKIYQWLVKLNPLEQNEFGRFVEMRGGKNRKNLLQMLELLLGMARSGREMSRERFFVLSQGEQPYDGNLLRKRLGALKKLLDDYLAMVELLRDPCATTAYRMRALAYRGWSEFVEAEYTAATALLAASDMGQDHFSIALQIEESHLRLVLAAPRRGNAAVFQQPLDHIDMHFLVQKLRYACAAFNQDRILGTQHDLGLLPSLLAYIAAHEIQLPPLVRMYYRIYRLLTDPTDYSHYEILQQDLNAHAARLTPKLVGELYQFILHHCTTRLHVGDQRYAAEIQEIYKTTLPSKVLLHQGKIDGGALKSMIAIVLLTGDIALAEALLHEYGPRLLTEADPSCIPYNQAVIYFHRGEYGKARKLCDTILRDAREIFLIVDARICLWCSSYALGDFEYCMAQYDDARMQLRRVQSMSRYHLEGYHVFVKGFIALIRIRLKYGDGQGEKRNIDLEKLQKSLVVCPKTASIRWLQEQVEEVLGA